MNQTSTKKQHINHLASIWGKEALVLQHIKDWKYVEIDEEAFSVVMINPYLQQKMGDVALFGFTHFPKDVRIARQLFQATEKEAQNFGAVQLIGPVNYSTWFNYRWMTEGWNKPRAGSEPYNPKYMPEFAKKCGYTEYQTYYSSIISAEDERHQYYKKKYEKVIADGFSFKRYKSSPSFSVLGELFAIAKEAFEDKPLYSPISRELFAKVYLHYYNKRDFIIDVCNYKDDPVGFSFGYVNPHDEGSFIWETVGLKKAFRRKGIGSAFRYLVHKYAIENNRQWVVQLLMHVKSHSRKLINEGNIIKKYAVFSKDIS